MRGVKFLVDKSGNKKGETSMLLRSSGSSIVIPPSYDVPCRRLLQK
jgi:hypothetical protein